MRATSSKNFCCPASGVQRPFDVLVFFNSLQSISHSGNAWARRLMPSVVTGVLFRYRLRRLRFCSRYSSPTSLILVCSRFSWPNWEAPDRIASVLSSAWVSESINISSFCRLAYRFKIERSSAESCVSPSLRSRRSGKSVKYSSPCFVILVPHKSSRCNPRLSLRCARPASVNSGE